MYADHRGVSAGAMGHSRLHAGRYGDVQWLPVANIIDDESVLSC